MTNRTERERGFAIPVALFALVVLGVLVTGGFYIARQETNIGAASEHGALAFYLAEKGMNEVLREWTAEELRQLAIWDDTTETGSEDEGTWSVEMFRAGPKVVYLESTGTVTRGGALLSGATRTVGAVARLFVADIDPPAALTTRGPTAVSGTADIMGSDSTPSAWDAGGYCDSTIVVEDDKPGIVTDDSSQVTGKGASSITGDPSGIEEDSSINDSTFTVFGNLTYDDLVELATWHRPGDGSTSVNGAAESMNGDGTCNTSDPDNWGNPSDTNSACFGWFPITHFSEDASINGDYGQGILLIDGNLQMQGNFTFSGIILVQGTVDLRGTGGGGIKILGGVMASNALLDDQSVTGGSSIQTSTCAVKRAVLNNAGTGRAKPLAIRSWVDISSVRN